MAAIITRAGKGSILTSAEMDANLTNLNQDKAEISSLASVATSGSFTDLTDVPAIPEQVNADWAAASGPAQILNKPTLGTAAAQNTSAFATAAQGTTADNAIPASQKGAANGVATLGAGGKIPESQIPAVAISDVFTVASQSAMLALTAERGDIAVRSDINKSFALVAEPASTLGNWIELRTPTDAVLSVAGKTGAVTLVKADVGLSNVNNTSDSAKAVLSSSKWTTARTLTLGATGKSVDGSANVSWTLAEIGAATENATLTDAAASSTLPATTATALTALLQTVRDCLKWLLANTLQLSGAQTAAGVKTFSDRSVHAGAYTPSAQPTHSATPTFDCATSNVFEPAAMTGNVTSITLSNAVAGQTVQIRFQQDATGGRTCAVPSGAKVDGAINTGANRVSWLVMTYSSRAARWEGNWLVVP